MKTSDALKRILFMRGWQITDFAAHANLKYQTAHKRIDRTNPKLDTLQEISAVLDYKLVAMPEDTPEQRLWYRIE